MGRRGWLPCGLLILAAGCGESDDPEDQTFIEGSLVEEGTGSPVTGTVTGSPDLGMVATSSPGGAFRFQGARYLQRYRIVAEAQGYLESEATIVPQFGVPSVVQLEMRPAIACSAGQRRCARGGRQGVETCLPDGRGFRFEGCGQGTVCDPSSIRCVGAPRLRVQVQNADSASDVVGGSVVSNPSGILCSPTCERTFPRNTMVQLEARSFGDSAFESWGGDCSGTTASCALLLDGDRTVRATFRTTAFRLTVDTTGGPGSVQSMPMGIDCGSRCQAFFPRDIPVTLTAMPGTGREFQRWERDCSGSTPTCVLDMSQARRARARFRRPGPTLEVTREGMGIGTVRSMPTGITCPTECSASFNNNQQVTLTAEPAAGSRFEGWGGDCMSAGMDATCMIQMSQSRTVSVRFEGDTVEVSVNLSGGGLGTVRSTPAGIDCGTTCSARFARGSTVELRATPGPDAAFFGWSGACASSGTAPTCTLQPDRDRGVGARFEPFYLAPLAADSACQYLLRFERPDRLEDVCGNALDASANGWTFGASRSGRMGDAARAPSGPDPIDLRRGGPLSLPATVELSVRPQGSLASTLFTDHDGRDPSRSGLALRVLGDGRLVATTFDGMGRSTSATTAAGAVSLGAWAHVAVVVDTNNLRIVVDGQAAAGQMGTVRFARSSSTAWVGAARTGTIAAQGFQGAMDEFRISDSARY